MESVWQLIQAWGLQVVGGVIFLLVGLVVAKTIRSWIRRALERSKLDDTLVPFLSGMVYYLLVVLIVIAVLGLFGIEMTAFIAVLGGAGLAVGLFLRPARARHEQHIRIGADGLLVRRRRLKARHVRAPMGVGQFNRYGFDGG